eukprot:TRINITY_DN9037_c0_g1_i3.p1 TRINITY_DN9037_c0_g1~~TRINITY_DN9037_c0_g1_i3.p1  ORF type:complete len:234 (-),score=44.47 TRINITY_DN9037_c0_g1_i3:65-721(-)
MDTLVVVALILCVIIAGILLFIGASKKKLEEPKPAETSQTEKKNATRTERANVQRVAPTRRGRMDLRNRRGNEEDDEDTVIQPARRTPEDIVDDIGVGEEEDAEPRSKAARKKAEKQAEKDARAQARQAASDAREEKLAKEDKLIEQRKQKEAEEEAEEKRLEAEEEARRLEKLKREEEEYQLMKQSMSVEKAGSELSEIAERERRVELTYGLYCPVL